ncbi:hypothetical protein J1614_000943 [Plenodomus biglobosus]|nr:hypothetical protein J1614_000943 [Plenodomus biglobosus]
MEMAMPEAGPTAPAASRGAAAVAAVQGSHVPTCAPSPSASLHQKSMATSHPRAPPTTNPLRRCSRHFNWHGQAMPLRFS